MTPQEILDHRLKWLPGYSVIVHSDARGKAVDWCNDNIQKQSWKLARFTSVYEDTFRFETHLAAEKFAKHFKGNRYVEGNFEENHYQG